MLPYLLSERAPHWSPLPRGAYVGLTRAHRREHLVRAALEGVCQQLALVLASIRDAGNEVREVRATGGFARSALWRQMLAERRSACRSGSRRATRAPRSAPRCSGWRRSGSSRASTSRPTSCGSRRSSSRDADDAGGLRARPAGLRRAVRRARARLPGAPRARDARAAAGRQRDRTDERPRARGSTVEPVSIVGLDHVQVAAPPGCEADARRFYGGVLDLPELPKPAALRDRGGVWFALGSGQALHVGVTEDFAAARKAHPALAVAGGTLATLAERLLAAGCEVRWDDAIPAVARCYVDDPWGNRLELVEQARMELLGPRKRHDAPVTLAEYDPAWAERYAREAAADPGRARRPRRRSSSTSARPRCPGSPPSPSSTSCSRSPDSRRRGRLRPGARGRRLRPAHPRARLVRAPLASRARTPT